MPRTQTSKNAAAHVTQHDVHSQNIDYHRVGCRVLPKQRVKGDIVRLSFLAEMTHPEQLATVGPDS